MTDWLSTGIGLKILFRRVCILGSRIYENMIPGLALARLRIVRLIPCLVGLALYIVIYDYAPVSVPLMADKLPNFKLRNVRG